MATDEFVTGTGLRCPKCQATMRNFERNGLFIDRCTECGGIFLDRGELERLVEAEASYYRGGVAAAAAASQPSPAPEWRDRGGPDQGLDPRADWRDDRRGGWRRDDDWDDDDDDRRGRGGGRRGFLDDLLDFG